MCGCCSDKCNAGGVRRIGQFNPPQLVFLVSPQGTAETWEDSLQNEQSSP